MRVASVFRTFFSSCRRCTHEKRFGSVLAIVVAITVARRVSVTAVGRAINSQAFAKHSIKRVDRLLSNSHMQSERSLYFRAIAHRLIASSRPVILLDWTKVTGDFHALVAALPVGGRAVTIYEEVHPQRKLGNSRIESMFLHRLRDVLPTGCCPIVVTDAGFKGPFFHQVHRLGWDFVGRVRGNTTMSKAGKRSDVASLYAKATKQARHLGEFLLYRTRTVTAQLVLIHGKRHSKHPWQKNRTVTGGVGKTTITGAKEPWLLATSVRGKRAKQIVRLYATRMQIEETFRDAKNHRFGWSMRHIRGYCAARLTVLFLLISIAMFIVTLIGLDAFNRNLQRRYQANTIKRRVLSNFVLGLEVIRRGDHSTPKQIREALAHFQGVLRGLTADLA
jgi:hypothetical protein